jgi:hypothetical protein
MTTLKYLVRGATLPSKSPSQAIGEPLPTEMGSVRRFAAPIADVNVQPADRKSWMLKGSLELGGVALLLYAAQAAIGFSAGLVLPWLFYFGVIHR